jgi:hypothetical protein
VSDPLDLIKAVAIGAILADIVRHAQEFYTLSEYVALVHENRCTWCGYKRGHPIVKHDNILGECGWR